LQCNPQSLTSHAVFGSKTDYTSQFEATLREVLANHENLKFAALLSFDSLDISNKLPQLLHASGPGKLSQTDSQIQYHYADASSPGFVIPGHPDFQYATAGVSHTRSLTFLKKHLGGPNFDLEKIWDEHTYFEFGDRSVEKTMATMVQEPYVNHIPTVKCPCPRLVGMQGMDQANEYVRGCHS
jgi:carboxymethylenebutenolidase